MSLRAVATWGAWLALVWLAPAWLAPVWPFAAGGNAAAQAITSAITPTITPAAGAVAASQWWPGFIDARGKAFLELPADTKLCALARDALRRAKLEPGRLEIGRAHV